MYSQDLFSQSLLKEKRTKLDKLRIEEEKKKLKEDINKLKFLRVEINEKLDYYKNCTTSNKILNDENNGQVQAWIDELYRYSGIHCRKFDEDREYQIEFTSFKNNSKRETYFVQILKLEEQGILGKWKMPILLDPNDILSKCPIVDFRQIKAFVMLCKHYLFCQEIRETQFEDLKAYIDDLHSCSVGGNREIFTSIQLQMFRLQEIETEKFYDIILYINYELNEVRPYKLIPDSLQKEILPGNVVKKLNKILKNFKRYELKSGFEKVIEELNGNEFRWEVALLDKDFTIENDEENNDRLSYEEKKELSTINEEQNLKDNRKEISNSRKMKNLKKMTSVGNSQSESSEVDKNVKTKQNLEKAKGRKNVNKTGLVENEIEEKKVEEKDNKIKSKNPGKKSKKVINMSVKLEKQTKLDFFQNNNMEQMENLNLLTKELEEDEKDKHNVKDDERTKTGGRFRIDNESRLEEEEEIEEGNKDEIKKKNVRKKTPKVSKIPVKSRKQTKLNFSHKTNLEQTEQLEDAKGENNAKNDQENNINHQTRQSNQETKNEKKEIKAIVQSAKKRDKNTIKKTMNLSNFVLKNKATDSLNTEPSKNASLQRKIPLKSNIKSSTPLPGQKRNNLEIDNEISEIIRLNKQIHKSPEKRPRSDSSDLELAEIVEEPNQSLLKNLEEVERQVSQAEFNKKVNKNLKGLKKGNKRTRKM